MADSGYKMKKVGFYRFVTNTKPEHPYDAGYRVADPGLTPSHNKLLHVTRWIWRCLPMTVQSAILYMLAQFYRLLRLHKTFDFHGETYSYFYVSRENPKNNRWKEVTSADLVHPEFNDPSPGTNILAIATI